MRLLIIRIATSYNSLCDGLLSRALAPRPCSAVTCRCDTPPAGAVAVLLSSGAAPFDRARPPQCSSARSAARVRSRPSPARPRPSPSASPRTSSASASDSARSLHVASRRVADRMLHQPRFNAGCMAPRRGLRDCFASRRDACRPTRTAAPLGLFVCVCVGLFVCLRSRPPRPAAERALSWPPSAVPAHSPCDPPSVRPNCYSYMIGVRSPRSCSTASAPARRLARPTCGTSQGTGTGRACTDRSD